MKIELATIQDVPALLDLQRKAFNPLCEELGWEDAPYGKRGDRTDEAARAESSELELCRVATEEDRRSINENASNEIEVSI